MNERLFYIGSYAAAFVALVDQLSKTLILERLLHPRPHGEIVTSWLNIVINWNKGVTFGMFNVPNSYSVYIFVAVALIILSFLFVWLSRSTSMYISIALGLVIGGALGNVIDRLRFGAVFDFIDMHIGSYHWYVYNLADAAIVCGVGLLLIEHLVTQRKKG